MHTQNEYITLTNAAKLTPVRPRQQNPRLVRRADHGARSTNATDILDYTDQDIRLMAEINRPDFVTAIDNGTARQANSGTRHKRNSHQL